MPRFFTTCVPHDYKGKTSDYKITVQLHFTTSIFLELDIIINWFESKTSSVKIKGQIMYQILERFHWKAKTSKLTSVDVFSHKNFNRNYNFSTFLDTEDISSRCVFLSHWNKNKIYKSRLLKSICTEYIHLIIRIFFRF